MNLTTTIPAGYLRLATIARLKQIRLSTLTALVKKGAMPDLIYSKVTGHYYLPQTLRIQIS
jgi:hypothetical protein